MNEADIQAFWNAHPCGDMQVGGLKDDYESFFNDYDTFRYNKEGHILRCLDGIDFKDKHVLEVGLGEGADSEQIIRRGAHWSGLDLTPESVQRVKARMALRHLSHEDVKQGTILNAPFDADSFDIVFSHGVLHHVPDVQQAQHEICRILKPEGELIVMLYAKWSLNYLVSIGIVRRLGLLALMAGGKEPEGMLGQHVRNARDMGVLRYLRMKNFVHRNTDGPLNPYAKVYDLAMVRQDFSDFKITKAYKVFMHAPPLPVRRLPLAGLLGWHLWVHMRPL